MIASALSLTQASEAGTVYRPDEIAALCDIAHERGMAVHMDGARFANALVRLECHAGARRPGRPASTCCRSAPPKRRAGGGSRGFLRSRARRILGRTAQARRPPRSPSTASSPRNSRRCWPTICWLKLARHANAMADRLARSSPPSASLRFGRSKPISSSSLCRAPLDARLKAAGARYYVRPSESLEVDIDRVLVRLVTSFATRRGRGGSLRRFVQKILIAPKRRPNCE